MELKHTNGPWYIGSEHDLAKEDEYPDADDVVYKDDMNGWPFFVGIKQNNHVDYHVAIGIQSLKDARLIAAAPELLLVCRRLAAFNINTPLIDTGVLPDLISAIAKAEGRAAK